MLLIGLPIEILHRVLSYLPSHRDVAAVALQCRALAEICEMRARKQFVNIKVSHRKKSIDPAFEQLMRILKRPILGHYVRYIECIPKALESGADYVMREYQRDLSEEEMRLLRAAVRNAGFEGSEDRVVNMLMQREPQRLLTQGDRT